MKHLTGRVGPHRITKVVVTDEDGDEHTIEAPGYARVTDTGEPGQPRRRNIAIHLPIERPTT